MSNTREVHYIPELVELQKNRIIAIREPLIGIDDSDFQLLNKGYRCVTFCQEELNYYELHLLGIDTSLISKIIVHITHFKDLEISIISKILENVKLFFNPEIDIIYGFAIDESKNGIIIDVFF